MTQDFRFDPVRFALPEGHSLFPIRDLDCYATLAARVGVCPHGFMLADLGPDAWTLRKTYWAPRNDIWRAFRSAVQQRHPHLPAWEDLTQNGIKFASLYELAVYRRLLALLPGDVILKVHPRLKDCFCDPKAEGDFCLTSQHTGKKSFIEVVGAFDQSFSAHSVLQQERRPETLRRLHRYPADERPVLIFKDMVCDPELRDAALRQALAIVRT
ncbi:hypothetical protein LOC54_09110 [Acetobacter sp. AN02]|uniref:hypothetical protein n=1 Tax=Acetobacter sp. AN02 TaxID=2894186 RepID=UPI0024342633|nr:hypothetical protein [Acetobacter sp. AN02]MDG6095260.1 hypothetical protein [Acetobacter sp. AN02]